VVKRQKKKKNYEILPDSMAKSIERFDIAEGYFYVLLKGSPDLKEEHEGYVREGAGL